MVALVLRVAVDVLEKYLRVSRKGEAFLRSERQWVQGRPGTDTPRHEVDFTLLTMDGSTPSLGTWTCVT
jgi:hypothetical protein